MTINFKVFYYCVFGISSFSVCASAFVFWTIFSIRHDAESYLLTKYVFKITVCDFLSSLFLCLQIWPTWTHDTPWEVIQTYSEPTENYYGTPLIFAGWGNILKFMYFAEVFFTVASWTLWFFIVVKIWTIMIHHRLKYISTRFETISIFLVSAIAVAVSWHSMKFTNIETKDHGIWVALYCSNEHVCSLMGNLIGFFLLVGMVLLMYTYWKFASASASGAHWYVPTRMTVFVGTYLVVWIPLLLVFIGTISIDPHIIMSSLAFAGTSNAIVWLTSYKLRKMTFCFCCKLNRKLNVNSRPNTNPPSVHSIRDEYPYYDNDDDRLQFEGGGLIGLADNQEREVPVPEDLISIHTDSDGILKLSSDLDSGESETWAFTPFASPSLTELKTGIRKLRKKQIAKDYQLVHESFGKVQRRERRDTF